MNVKRIIYIACLLLFLSLQGYAQKETWNWTFGQYAGLTFKPDQLRSFSATGIAGTDTPDAILHHLPAAFKTPMYTGSGVFSLSDKEGNLLFYSDGMRLWDGDGMELPYSMDGDIVSSQSGILLTYPGEENKYLVIVTKPYNSTMSQTLYFTPDNTSMSDRVTLYYGIGTWGGALSATKHANGQDWWIASPGRGLGASYFNAWLATSAGVDALNPVKTRMPEVSLSEDKPVGYLKFSPDGKYFVYAANDGYAVFGEFNNQTGEVSNVKTIHANTFQWYGVEFSPNQKYVYLTRISLTSTAASSSILTVFDLEAVLQGTTTPVKEINYLTIPAITALQLDPFGRMWGAGFSSRDMYLIDNPDEPENINMYLLKDFLLENTYALYGLPSFASSWFYRPMKGADNFCVNTEQTYTFKVVKTTEYYELSHTEWDFGDGTVVTDDTFEDQTQNHTYTKPGNYTITVRCFLGSDGSEVTTLRQTLKVRVKGCRLPVNHNTTTMKY